MPKRRSYSPEYKHEAVQLVKTSQVSASQIARDLGINPNMLSRWCREAEASPGKEFPGRGKARDEEMAALKREVSRVKKERDFLREAATFFAKARSEVPHDRALSRCLPGSPDVSLPGGITRRLLRLARPPTQPAGQGQPGLAGAHQDDPCRE